MTGAARTQPAAWPRLASRRAERLLLPFLLFGAAFVLGKFLASRFMYVDNAVRSLPDAFAGLVWDTDRSPAISIWYMYVIFVAALVTPPLIWAGRGSTWLLATVALALFLLGLPHRMFSDRFAEYFVFFVIGGVAADLGERWLAIVDRWWLAALLALVVAASASAWLDLPPTHWAHLLCGCLAMPALHGIVRRTSLGQSRLLAFLGAYSFVIYLLNTPAMGFAKGIMLKWVPWDGAGFVLHALVMLACGLLVPVMAKVLVFRRWRYLDKLTA